MYDSPELALVAEQLGLGHPFGQPLHTMLGAIVSRVPGLDPLIALNGLSALTGALTVIPATSFAEALLRPDPDCPKGDARLVAPTIALLGVHPALWEPSTRIEVYPLAAFFALWAGARFVHALLDRDPRLRSFFATGLALGLSASANVICAFIVASAMTPRLLIANLRREIPWGSIGSMTAGGLLGLTCYGYVFAVAGRNDVVVWGSPTSAASIAHYFTGADFRYKSVASWTEWLDHIVELIVWMGQNGLLGIWLVGFAGYALFARQRGLGRLFFNATWMLFVAFIARNGVFATDVLDYAGYLAIPVWLAASGAGLFTAYLAGRNAWSAAAVLSAFLIMVMVVPPAPHRRSRHLDSFTEDLAREALDAAPDEAILLVEHDHWVAPMWYLQEQRGIRPDVVVLAYGLSSSEWYWNLLYRRHPELSLIELRAPGGRDARIRRFLRANSGRPLQVERVALAMRIGLPTCPSEWLLNVSPSCTSRVGEPALTRLCNATLAELKQGSPGTDGLIALITLHRGHDLYSQGLARAAIAALLSGVPRTAGSPEVDLAEVSERIPRGERPVPLYAPRVALGHPAQNLHYAALIARAAGARKLARHLSVWSDALGPVEPKFATSPASADTL